MSRPRPNFILGRGARRTKIAKARTTTPTAPDFKPRPSRMSTTPKLNFPAINLRAAERDGRTTVFDRIRSMYVVLTPEEWVRRHLVEYLIEACGAPLRSIVEEYPVPINSTAQRADVVVVDSSARPLALAECKAPDVPITREVFEQATRYNAVVGARYIILTNGLRHFCFELTAEGYRPLAAFPRLDPSQHTDTSAGR